MAILMTPEQKRRQEMIDYLNTLKFAHQSHALNEISRHGSEEYAKHEMDKAKMVGEIVEIVEGYRPELHLVSVIDGKATYKHWNEMSLEEKDQIVYIQGGDKLTRNRATRKITEHVNDLVLRRTEVPEAPRIPTRNGMSKP